MEFLSNPLSALILLPAAAALALLAVPERNGALLKNLALLASVLVFAVSVRLYLGFDPSLAAMQFQLDRPWLPAYGIHYYLGIDGISLLMILLTTLLTPIAILASFNYIKEAQRAYYICLLFLEASMIGVFAALDLFAFYLFWEGMLIPMYFLIGVWGGPRRIYAALKFFIYTMAGSVLMLVAILWLVSARHAIDGVWTFSIPALYGTPLEHQAQFWLFAAFALAFAVKVPLFPFHTWLPDAHVEAPTAGSVLLAGVLLKMGVYGYLRLAVPLFPQGAAEFAPWLAVLGVTGIIYGSLVAWTQRDMKKLVAYSSVAHLGIVILGVMAFEPAAVAGAVLQMVNHGLSTGALFLLVGVLYERRHTRMIEDYGGLAKSMPMFSVVLMIVMLSSIGLPGLNGFVGEALILFGSFKVYPWLAGAAVAGVILSAVYMLGMYQAAVFGPLRHTENKILPDLSVREWLYLAPLLLFIVLIGVRPNPLLKLAMPAVNNYITMSQRQTAPVLPGISLSVGRGEEK
ncbi:MAG TPA: Fe-S-binding domain-containing protein [Elusimicrobia bacterium]|nr:MAG: NADH dehydrogenase [Elusimicrobia bacterium GWF2_62_30]HBA59917.1 Fe-S-binding domain-containing protein [Elusimicrobiota bacterium]